MYWLFDCDAYALLAKIETCHLFKRVSQTSLHSDFFKLNESDATDGIDLAKFLPRHLRLSSKDSQELELDIGSDEVGEGRRR